MAASAAASSASFMIVPPWILPAVLASVTPISGDCACESDSDLASTRADPTGVRPRFRGRGAGTSRAAPASLRYEGSVQNPAKEDAMPGLSGRMSTVIKAKISKLLDRAEDPPRRSSTATRSRSSCSRTSRRGSPTSSPRRSACSFRSRSSSEQVVKLDTQARQALAAGNEELARTALERKNVAQTELQSLDTQIGQLEQQQEQMTASEQKLRTKIEQFRSQEGGHQGPVLGRRGAGADLRGGDRRGRGDGRRRPGDAAGARQDREHEGARGRRSGARGGRHVRGPDPARRGRGRHRPPAQGSCRAPARSTPSWPR